MKKTTQSCCLMVGVLVKDVAHVVASTYNNKNSYFAEQTVKSKVDFLRSIRRSALTGTPQRYGINLPSS